MPLLPLIAVGGIAALFAGGGLWAAGEGVDEAGNGAMKLALAAGVGFLIYRAVIAK